MSKVISNKFSLTGVINGMTLRAKIIRDTTSPAFFQFWDKDENVCKPNWQNGGPKWYVEVTDAKGHSYNPYNLKLMWNATEVTFGTPDANGIALNTAGVLGAGTVKKWTANDITYFQLIKNVFDTGNDDNDVFYMTGKVSLQGNHPQDFRTDTENVTVIQTASGGTSYYVDVEVHDIDETGGTGTCIAHLYSSSESGEVTQGITCKWYNMTDDNAEECTVQKGYTIQGRTLTVPAEEVNGLELFRVDVTVTATNKTYIGYGQMQDKSDPWYLKAVQTGGTGHNEDWIEEGETVTVRAYIVDKEGTVVSNSGLTPSFTVNDAAGNTLTAGTDYTEISNENSVRFTYDQVMSAGGSVTGYLTARRTQS